MKYFPRKIRIFYQTNPSTNKRECLLMLFVLYEIIFFETNLKPYNIKVSRQRTVGWKTLFDVCVKQAFVSYNLVQAPSLFLNCLLFGLKMFPF